MEEMHVRSLGGEDPLKKEMATHSSILAWKIHGQKSRAGCSLWDCKGSDMTEHSNNKGGSMVRNPPVWRRRKRWGGTGDEGLIPGSGRSPGVSMATHSSIFSWKIPWAQEADGLQAMGFQRAGHDWATEHTQRKRRYLPHPPHTKARGSAPVHTTKYFHSLRMNSYHLQNTDSSRHDIKNLNIIYLAINWFLSGFQSNIPGKDFFEGKDWVTLIFLSSKSNMVPGSF